MRARYWVLVIVAGLFQSVLASTENIVLKAMPAIEYGHILGGLVLVIVSIGVLAIIFKWVRGVKTNIKSLLSIEGGLSLGARDKILLINAEGHRLLIGLSGGSIRTLYVFPEKNAVSHSHPGASTGISEIPSNPEFSKWLQDILKKDL